MGIRHSEGVFFSPVEKSKVSSTLQESRNGVSIKLGFGKDRSMDTESSFLVGYIECRNGLGWAEKID